MNDRLSSLQNSDGLFYAVLEVNMENIVEVLMKYISGNASNFGDGDSVLMLRETSFPNMTKHRHRKVLRWRCCL